MHVRRLAAIAAAALLLPLAACSDGESNAEPSGPTTSAATSTSPSSSEPSTPPVPANAQGSDTDAAKAFVRFYFGLISEAIRTGDTEAVRQFSAGNCKSCDALASRIENIHEAGGYFRVRQGWAVRTLVIDPQVEPGTAAFYARVDMPRQRLFNSDGQLTAIDKPRMQGMRLVLRRSEAGWVMQRMDLLR